MRRTPAPLSPSQLIEELEQRKLLTTGFFSAGIDIDLRSGSESAFIFNSFGEYDSANGQISFSNRSRSDGSFDSIDAQQFSVTTKLRPEVVFENGGQGISEYNWNLTDGSDRSEGLPLSSRTRLAFNTSFTGDDQLRIRLATDQAEGLTAADRDGSYRFTGLIYDSDAWSFATSYGLATITNGDIAGTEFTSIGEVPLSGALTFTPDDGYTESTVPGYVGLYSGSWGSLATGFNQGPNSNFNSLSYAIRSDGTQPGVNDQDAFRGDDFAFSLVGLEALFPELFIGGFGIDGGYSQNNVVLQIEPSGNTAHFYHLSEYYDSINAQPFSTGEWSIGADLGFRYQTTEGFSIDLRYGGENGDEMVGEMISDGTNSSPIFAVGTRVLNGEPSTDGGGGTDGEDDTPADAGVCYKSVTTKVENGEHLIIGTADDGTTYTWKVADIEGSGMGYVGVSANLQDGGKTILVNVVRDDFQTRQLRRPDTGEWEVKGDGSDSQTVSVNVQVDNAVDINPVSGLSMQVGFDTNAGTAEVITNTQGDGSDFNVAPISIENGPINFAMGIDLDTGYDAEFTTWSAYHGAYLGPNNEIWMFWNSPVLGADYRIDNIAASANAPAADPSGRISVATTTYGSIHVGYTSATGEYGHLYWNIGQGGDWAYAALETAVGAPMGGLGLDPATVYTGFDYEAGRLFAVGSNLTGMVAGVDWLLGRQQWQYASADVPEASGGFVPGGDVGLAEDPVLIPAGSTSMLLDMFNDNAGSQVPVLGTLPILGNLFANSTFERQEAETIVIITPTLREVLG